MKYHSSKSKKGAIEMSMQTIIVVVIGITLLTLGLRFVYQTFGDISGQQKAVNEATQKQLRELFGESDDPVALISNSVSIKQGETEDFVIGFNNIGNSQGNFAYKINFIPSGNSQKPDWMPSGEDLGPLDVGDDTSVILPIEVPEDAVPGSYRFNIELDCTADSCGDSKRFPFTIRVLA